MPEPTPPVPFHDRPPPWRLLFYGPLAVECVVISLPLLRNQSWLAVVPLVLAAGLLIACWQPTLAPLLLVFTVPAWLLPIMLSGRWQVAGGLVGHDLLAALLILGLPLLAIVQLVFDTVRYGYRGGRDTPERAPVTPDDD